MKPADFERARTAALAGDDLATVAAALGVSLRTLQRAWLEHTGQTPAAWLRGACAAKPARAIPPVFYRLSADDRERLDRRAAAAGVSPNELARSALYELLDRGS